MFGCSLLSTLGTLVLFFFVLPVLPAQEVQRSRTFVQYSALLTRGDDSGWGSMGWGGAIRSLTYWDSQLTEGLYYGFLSAALSRSAGGIGLADTRLATLGYRGNPEAWFIPDSQGPLQFDGSLSPTLGTRIEGDRILGSWYTGIGLTVGLHFAVSPGDEIGLSWEPVVPLAAWGGAGAPNRGYQDFVVSWTRKTLTETRTLPWQGNLP